MLVKTLIVASALLAGPVLAQSVPSKPLDLNLPPQDIPAATASAPAKADPAPASSSLHSAAMQPGKYYGDTSGRTYPPSPDRQVAPCDDATYNKAHVHGSVGMGVVAGNHFGGNYETGTVHVTKAFGSCEHPTGGMSISIGVLQNHMNGDGSPF